MRVAGALIVVLGVVGAVALPILGLPGAFGVLLLAALTLWLVAVPTAAACLAPPRRIAGTAALGSGVLGWPLLLAYPLSPLWGALIAICGVVVIADRIGWVRPRGGRAEDPGTPA